MRKVQTSVMLMLRVRVVMRRTTGATKIIARARVLDKVSDRVTESSGVTSWLGLLGLGLLQSLYGTLLTLTLTLIGLLQSPRGRHEAGLHGTRSEHTAINTLVESLMVLGLVLIFGFGFIEAWVVQGGFGQG